MTNRVEIFERHNMRLGAIRIKYECDCKKTVVTRRKISNGVIQAWVQCCSCGRAVRSVRKADYDVNILPWFDEELKEHRRLVESAEWERERARFDQELAEFDDTENQRKEAEGKIWWEKYNQYLRSQQWHTLRKKVLERDGKTCQACLTREATQVHHLFYSLYNQLGFSAAFECVAICHTCHEKIHPHMAQIQHNMIASGHSPYLEGARNGHR